MNIVLVNGSPRKNGATAKLLCAAADGAKSVLGESATVERIDVYSKKYGGCKSCFGCKLPSTQGKGCILSDEMTEDLKKAENADVLILGTPVYFFSESCGFRAFFERLLYPYKSFLPGVKTIFPKKIQSGIIYTMNVTEEQYEQISKHMEIPPVAQPTATLAGEILGTCETFVAYDTQRTNEYERYVVDMEKERAKEQRFRENFPLQLDAAYAFGGMLARRAMGE